MRRPIENPKKFIVSCRLHEEEMAALQELAKKSGCSISTLLRNSLGLLDEQDANQLESLGSISELIDFKTRKAS